MKKHIFIFLFICLSIHLFSKEQIGTCDKNVYRVGVIQKNIPVCFYYENVEGLISIIKKYYIKIGNNAYGPYDSIDAWLFTSDKIIYKAKVDDETCLFINGNCVARYKSMSIFFLSDDNESLIYAYETDSGVYLQSKSKTVGPFEEMKFFLVDDNGEILSYVIKEKSNYYIYAEENKYGPFDDVYDWLYQNKNYVYGVEKNKKKYIYNKNGLYAGPYNDMYLKWFSSNGKQLAYITFEDNKDFNSPLDGTIEILWVNKEKLAEGWYINNIRYIGDFLLYNVNTVEDGNYINFGNLKYGPYVQIRDVTISPDKKIVAFSYSNNDTENKDYYLRVGNEKAGPYDDCYYITFSNDSKNIAYVIKKNGKRYLVNKQKQFGPYEIISNINFSEDGKLLAYVSSDKYYNNSFLHIDNFKSKKYDYISKVKFYKDILTYTVEINKIYYDMILLQNTEYIGSYVNDCFVYFDNGKIFME